MPLEGDWKVHLVRSGQSNMGVPTYLYGRTTREIGSMGIGRKVVPSEGLLSHLTRIGMDDELTEAGVTIQLSRRSFEGTGQRFRRIFTAEDRYGRITHTYASDHPDEEGTVAIFSFECDCSLPRTVWIRVESLDSGILAASLANEWIEGAPPSIQSKMDDFADIEIETSPSWCSTDEEVMREARSAEREIGDIIGRLGLGDEDQYPDFQLPGPPTERLES